ncbi:MAG: thymidylate kinase [Methanomassiliicoccales archaeon]|jgi:dTMP kinase|nr:thymidylate kinase [Methanomassiliicoccales archaeon]
MRWVVVDGIDGSGKSTLAFWIKDRYERKGENVLVRVHPSSSWIGRTARRALEGEGKVLHMIATLFFILDVLDSVRQLRRDSRRYQTIIFVRYLMATAYLPKRLAPAGYDFFAKLLPVPKRLILVDVDPASAHRRIMERQHTMEMFEDIDSLGRVREKVLMLAERGGWWIVDNTRAQEETRQQLLQALEEWDSSPT